MAEVSNELLLEVLARQTRIANLYARYSSAEARLSPVERRADVIDAPAT